MPDAPSDSSVDHETDQDATKPATDVPPPDSQSPSDESAKPRPADEASAADSLDDSAADATNEATNEATDDTTDEAIDVAGARTRSWAWVTHRIAAVVTALALTLAALTTGLARVSPDDYNRILGPYQSPLMLLVQVAVVAAVLYYLLSGFVLMALRLTPGTPRFRWVTVAMLVLWVALLVPAAYLVGDHPIRQLFGGTG